jgi:reticulon-4-interacting protein 1, mitochondrial
MATQQAKAWTYTAGYGSVHSSTINPPTPSDFQKEQNGSSNILVQIKACALNPVDIQIMNLPTWNMPWNPLKGIEKGCVNDFSGTVMAAGAKSSFKTGDDIFGLTLQPYMPNGGSLGEVAVFDAGKICAVKKPAQWSHEKASAISLVWLTAKACIESVEQYVDSSQSKRVAILGGSSATGIYTIILAKRKGWQVATTTSSRNKDFVVNDLKADTHIDYTSQDVRGALLDFAPDAVIDCVGGTEAIGLPSSKRYVSIVGDKTGRTSMGGPYTYWDYLAPQRMATQWFRWGKGALGMGESYDVIVLGMKPEWLEDAKETLKEDDIYIDSVHDFDKANEAFERLNTGRAKGKVVVKVAKG